MTATEKAAELRRLERRARELRREIKAARPKTPRPKAPGKPQKQRSAERAEARRSTRPRVAERDGGCAVRAIGGCRGNLHHDHFLGRGKQAPDVQWEWMLCEEHDHRKTHNVPSRAYWIGLFRIHAQSHGYEEVAQRCEVLLDYEAAQHPSVAVRVVERSGT